MARRGAASVEPPRPRPAAPRLTSPRGPGGAGPRSRVPLQQPPPARSQGLPAPPRPAAARSEVTGSTNETLRAGGPDRGRPARSLEGPFGGLCRREQGACADARGRSRPAKELAPEGAGRGGAGGRGSRRGAGLRREQEMGPVVSTPGIRKGTRVGEKRKRWRKGLKRQKGEGQDDGSLRRAGDRLGVGEDTQRGAGLGDLREDWWWGAGTCWLGKAFCSVSDGRPCTAAVPWCGPCAGWGAVLALQTWEWGGGQWSLHIFHPGIPQILSFRLQLQAPPEPPVLPVRAGRAGAAGGGAWERKGRAPGAGRGGR